MSGAGESLATCLWKYCCQTWFNSLCARLSENNGMDVGRSGVVCGCDSGSSGRTVDADEVTGGGAVGRSGVNCDWDIVAAGRTVGGNEVT